MATKKKSSEVTRLLARIKNTIDKNPDASPAQLQKKLSGDMRKLHVALKSSPASVSEYTRKTINSVSRKLGMKAPFIKKGAKKAGAKTPMAKTVKGAKASKAMVKSTPSKKATMAAQSRMRSLMAAARNTARANPDASAAKLRSLMSKAVKDAGGFKGLNKADRDKVLKFIQGQMKPGKAGRTKVKGKTGTKSIEQSKQMVKSKGTAIQKSPGKALVKSTGKDLVPYKGKAKDLLAKAKTDPSAKSRVARLLKNKKGWALAAAAAGGGLMYALNRIFGDKAPQPPSDMGPMPQKAGPAPSMGADRRQEIAAQGRTPKKEMAQKAVAGKTKRPVLTGKVAAPATAKATTIDPSTKNRITELKKKYGVGPGDSLTGNEAFVAAAATALGAQVPAISKSAHEITAFLGKHLQPLGLTGLAAGATVLIGKYLASKRTGRPFLQSLGVKKRPTLTGKSGTYSKGMSARKRKAIASTKKQGFSSWMKKRRKKGM